MIRVRMRVDDVREFPTFSFQQPNVVVDALEDGINNRRLSRLFTRDQIRSTRAGIELFENHRFVAADYA
jgi:hypothetical protein